MIISLFSCGCNVDRKLFEIYLTRAFTPLSAVQVFSTMAAEWVGGWQVVTKPLSGLYLRNRKV